MNARSTAPDATALDKWVQCFEGVRRSAPGLAGIDGRLLLEIEGNPVATLQVADGNAILVRNEDAKSSPDGAADFADVETLLGVMSGGLNAVVASLQGRMFTSGNLFFTTKTILGLQADKSFAMPIVAVAKEGERAD